MDLKTSANFPFPRPSMEPSKKKDGRMSFLNSRVETIILFKYLLLKKDVKHRAPQLEAHFGANPVESC